MAGMELKMDLQRIYGMIFELLEHNHVPKVSGHGAGST